MAQELKQHQATILPQPSSRIEGCAICTRRLRAGMPVKIERDASSAKLVLLAKCH